MKRTLPWPPALALLSLITLAAWAETPPLPTAFPEARYQQMRARSPFAVATAAVATAAPTPGFAAQLYVDGVAHVGSTDFVAIKSKDPDHPVVSFLEVGGTDKEGMKVERVSWSPVMGKSTVDVSKGGEKATLEFDEATVKTVAAAAPPPGPPGMRLPPLPGQGRPMNFQLPNGQPQFNRFYDQQPGQVQPGQPGMNTPQQRRRIRNGMIQSGQ